MIKGKTQEELDNNQIHIPDAFIIDELTKNQNTNQEFGYHMPYYQDDNEQDQASSTEESCVIIIEI